MKPFFFLGKMLHEFKLSSLTLFTPLFVQYNCNLFIEIDFYKARLFIINLCYRSFYILFLLSSFALFLFL